MEYIIISDTKIKITLTQRELDKYNIDSENFSIGNETQRHSFRKLLNEACRQSGFDSSCARLMVQLFPSKKGGCEIFVTRLTQHQSEVGGAFFSNIYNDENAPENENTVCFSFSSFRHLNAVCRQLLSAGYEEESDVYVSEGGIYYLILSECVFCEKEYSLLSFIGEFAKAAIYEIPVYIYEHGRLLCEKDAVRVIGSI